MGKIFTVYRERCVALLIVDVKINDIAGNFLLAESLNDLAGARFGIISVAALLVAKRPERRKRRAADKRSELLDDFLGFRAGNKIIVKFAAFGSKGKVIGQFFSEVEAAAVGVVEENAIGRALVKADEKRNRLVERVVRLLPAVKISIPHRVRAIAVVQGTGLVAQAIII